MPGLHSLVVTPLHPSNRSAVDDLMQAVKRDFPAKTIWVYTGYTWEEVMQDPVMAGMMKSVDVLVDGKFLAELKDVNYPGLEAPTRGSLT